MGKKIAFTLGVICLLGINIPAEAFSPSFSLDILKTQPAKQTVMPSIPEAAPESVNNQPQKPVSIQSEIVRVGIGNSAFSSYVYKQVGVYGTAPLDIYQDGVWVKQAPANTNVNVYINPDFSYTLKTDDGEEIISLTGIIKFTSTGGCLGVKGLSRAGKPALYHGYFDIMPIKGKQQFNLVNKLPVEVYLRGVVPNEMPISFGLEALKAQSIAARNYVLTPRVKASNNYDVVDSVASQVYYGANTEKELSNKAVAQTEGIVALYNWDLILALYSSTAGGYTESYSNAFSDPQTKEFPAREKPYLIAKPDILYQTPLNRDGDAAEYYKDSPDAYDVRSPYFRWTREWNAEELRKNLEQTLVSQSATGFVKPVFNKGDTLGELIELRVVRRGDSGKIMEMEIVTQNQTYKVYKELVIRRLLIKDGKTLPSANIVFENAQDNDGNLISIKAYGGGFGHGVGLSQFGAGFMGSELHLPYYKILQHYYSGISLTTKPVIISTELSQIKATQQFYAPEKSAKIIIDNKFGVNQLSAEINGQKHIFNLPKEVWGHKRYVEIDISKYINVGKNIVEFSSPEFAGSSLHKGLRLYVELVGKDDSGNIWE